MCEDIKLDFKVLEKRLLNHISDIQKRVNQNRKLILVAIASNLPDLLKIVGIVL